MINRICCCLILLFSQAIFAQELNCRVEINSDKIAQTNKQIFKSLKSSITDFMNNTQFSTLPFSKDERIECNLLLIVDSYDNNFISGSLQITSSRPVYNSNYTTQILNFKDNQVSFKYIEFEPLVYSENSFSSDLVGILSFYANLVIGLDSDSFEKLSGTSSLQKANNIVNMAQSNGGIGWKATEKSLNRYHLINDILSNSFVAYREALYDYHRNGMDQMIADSAAAKQALYKAISKLEANHKYRPNALPTRVFFDAKVDEIVSVFNAGPDFNKQQITDLLNRIYPFYSGKWSKI